MVKGGKERGGKGGCGGSGKGGRGWWGLPPPRGGGGKVTELCPPCTCHVKVMY